MSAGSPGGTQPTVLVIDDDDALRAVVSRVLERARYRVVAAASGREAMDRLREGLHADLVVTDLQMDDGSGGWFLANLGYEFPALIPRTLIVSGDASGARAAHIAARWRCPILPKPFAAAELLAAMESLAASGTVASS